MVSPRAPSAEIIIHCFDSRVDLSAEERHYLQRMVKSPKVHSAGSEIIASGTPLDNPLFLLSGWAFAAVNLSDGRRQIIDFHLPGDILGLSTRANSKSYECWIALTTLVTANARAFLSFLQPEADVHYPGLARIARIVECEREMRHVRHIVRLGSQLAPARMASLILDLARRIERCGLMNEGAFELPITQEFLGNALGMSTVHVNRTLQQLRHGGLIRLKNGTLEVLNRTGLERAAEDEVSA